jgi:hypothetical protein
MAKRIRIRAKRLDEIDETKLALAFWLIARDMVENKTAPSKGARKPKASGPSGDHASSKEPV